MLQEKLKQHTATLHDQLEQLMYVNHIMQRTLTPLQYNKLLMINYLVHEAYEQRIFDAIGEDLAKKLNLPARSKLKALTADLASQHIDSQNFSKVIAPLKAKIPDSAFALGAMYVLEGATLGGSVIVKQLKLNANFSPQKNFSYYGVYGAQLIPNWQQFLTVLNAIPEKNHQQAMNGAKFMFNEIAAVATQLTNSTINQFNS